MHKVQKKFDLNSVLLKLQKPIVLFMFFAIIAVFVYSLVYMTPFFGLYKADATLLNKYLNGYGLTYDMFNEKAWVLKNGKPIGIDIKYFTLFVREAGYMQEFNRWMFNTSFIGILVTCSYILLKKEKDITLQILCLLAL